MKLMRILAKTAMIPMMLGLLGLLAGACSEDPTLPDGNFQDGDDNGGEQDCPVLCSTDADCCQGQTCRDGVCSAGNECPTGCNYQCDKAAGEICDPASKRCITGAPPVNCRMDNNNCDCFTGEACVSGQCQPIGGDQITCVDDNGCPDGQVCRDGTCRPATCQTREDCAGGACLVCKSGACTAPPPVCQGNEDCCVGFRCNFGTCTPEQTGCQSDSDCHDPEFPRCKLDTHECIPECVVDIDCPLPGYICQDKHCISPGCTPQQCNQGEWCDTGDGTCKPGCDSNDDCLPPNTCNYASHSCGQVDCCGGVCTPGDQYCDNLTCQCVDLCQDNSDCPANYNCDQASGKCKCTDLACPAGSHCDAGTGNCVRDGDTCDPLNPNCPAGYVCDPNQLVCIPSGSSGEGDPCFTDSECDASQSLLCDNAIFCFLCILEDSNFFPTYTCRYECSMFFPQCPVGTCKTRRAWFGGLCIP